MLDQQRREATRSFTRPAPAISSADAAQILADPEVQAALAAGRKIEAIKLVREKTGLGLKEAKELVEASV
ncbi:MAG: ribosomal protein L7/L12 [Sphingomonadaceae bacterium]|nr:ribosomal protein L7/L12 [Sphingomonadaceae bacterium]